MKLNWRNNNGEEHVETIDTGSVINGDDRDEQGVAGKHICCFTYFKLNDSAEWCDANLHKLQQRISQLEQQSIQPQSTAAPVLAEWDQLMASFEDFFWAN